MTNILYTRNYVDGDGKNIVWDNNIKAIKLYDASNESWDKTGGGTKSWCLENTLPSDSFVGISLDADRWGFFNFAGTISGSVDSCLVLNIENKTARGGVSSENLWRLSGDFDIKLYIAESSYYNEYRSNAASGLTVSVDSSNKFRVSKYFDGTSIGYKTHHIEDKDLRYFGWFDNGSLVDVSGDETTSCLRLIRNSDSIEAQIGSSSGFVTVGSGVCGSSWTQPVSVEIEVETEQENTYRTNFTGISVSGTLQQGKQFSSLFRGDSTRFPSSSLLVVDGSGLSMIDLSDMSLWARFVCSGSGMFTTTDTEISPAEGKIYYTTTTGLYCIDFQEDILKKYLVGNTYKAQANIANRNNSISFYNSGTNSFINDNEVLSVAAKTINNHEYVVVGTASGVGICIDGGSKEFVWSKQQNRSKTVRLFDDGTLFWNNYNTTTNSGSLYYRSNIMNLLASEESTFDETGIYSTSSVPSISNGNITDVSYSSGNLAIAHSCGIDYIEGGLRTTFGPVTSTNLFTDPLFESQVGVYWLNSTISGCVFPIFECYSSSDWGTGGGDSLKLAMLSGARSISGGSGGTYQTVNTTYLEKIYFDLKFVNTGDYAHRFNFEVFAGPYTLFTATDIDESYETIDNIIDLSGINGDLPVGFRLVSTLTGAAVSNKYFYVSNVRVVQTTPDFAIIPSGHEVLENLLFITSTEKKLFFSTYYGYGCIDVATNSLDFFTEISSAVPLASVVSAEYIEVVSAV